MGRPPIPLPGSLRTGQVALARPERQQAVAAQRIVVVVVFVTHGNSPHPVDDQPQHRVFDLPGTAIIGEAVRNPLHQPQPAVHLAQKHGAAVAGEQTRAETTHDLTLAEGVRFKLAGSTLCAHGTALLE